MYVKKCPHFSEAEIPHVSFNCMNIFLKKNKIMVEHDV